MGSQEVNEMENKKAAILVLAIAAALLIAASATYAMMSRQTQSTGSPYGSGTGPSMMGGSAGYSGGMMGGYGGYSGMMGGHGMMGGYGASWNGTSPYWCAQYAEHHLNSTSSP